MEMIQRATLKDVKKLEEINVTANKEQSWWIPQNAHFYKKFLKNRNNDLYVAFENNVLIGFLTLEHNKERKCIWINDVYVLPRNRKNGVAKMLIQKVIQDWKKKSKSMVLLTSDRNLAIFKKLGFKKTMNFMEFEDKELFKYQ